MSISNDHFGIANLETLLFKATNPANKIEDVNTIKQFCDAVSRIDDGSAIACRLIAHKIQSPQEREAIQALAVLEACVKSCGQKFHAEVGKFKFLNELIKLLSPRYLGSTTPEHIKKKVIEMLFIWTKELESESKIKEAYHMLKSEGIVKKDPEYVGKAVFASALPPRPPDPLNEEKSKQLKILLQSKSPEDLQRANEIIKDLVREDERRMDMLTKRATDLVMVNNNSKLLNEMLDHYDKRSSGPEEIELIRELYQASEKMQPKLFKLAAETDEQDDTIGEIIQVNEDLSNVLERYKMVIIQGKPDIAKTTSHRGFQDTSEQLLDIGSLNTNATSHDSFTIKDDEILANLSINDDVARDPPSSDATNEDVKSSAISLSSAKKTPDVSIDDLLYGDMNQNDSISNNELLINQLSQSSSLATKSQPSATEQPKSSRQRGLEELDLLGEAAIKSHLTSRSPQFAKKNGKVSLNEMQQLKSKKELNIPVSFESTSQSDSFASGPLISTPIPNPSSRQQHTATTVSSSSDANSDKIEDKPLEDKPQKNISSFNDLIVDLNSIKPSSIPPITVQSEEDGLCVVLNFAKEMPQEDVHAVVVTILNNSTSPVSDIELKAVVPKGCKVKLQRPSGQELPAHNPFVPPSAITQVMLIFNPSKKSPISWKYVLSYSQDDEQQTEMGEVKELPLQT